MTPLVQVTAVSHTFWRGVRATNVLNGVTLELHAGELGGIWGRRGSGKTTLARIAAGVLVPDEGHVVFDGKVLSNPEHDGVLMPQLGLASRQGPEFEDMDPQTWIISTLVHLSSWRDAKRRASAALDRVGVGDVAGVPWQHLSDGERMLCSIAQAIARGPRLIVVDDPVAGLGGKDRAEIMDLLRSLAAAGIAVLMTAAELPELRGVDQIWSLDRGRLDGPPARPAGTVVPLRASDGA
jgi:ABC-type multidrug transport system ATPase subunit